MYDWQDWARPEQLPPPGNWFVWLILAGRGFGKSRTSAEFIRALAERRQKLRLALVGRTAADVRDTMVEGESGILAVSRPSFMPVYEPSKRRVTWPDGTVATCYAAEEPNQLRGPQHHFAAVDELASFPYPETFENLVLGLRLGSHPRCVVTTTPRPIKILRDLIKASSTVVTRGSTYDNAENLPPSFLEELRRRYEGTRLGRQELFAEVLEDVPGALWNRAQIDLCRVRDQPEMERIEIGVDPAVTSGESSDETGIIVAGKGRDKRGYILEDLTCRASPDAWAKRVVEAYHRHRANRVIAEVNNGGDLVTSLIKTVDPRVVVLPVRASHGKRARAEPVAALYEQGKVSHVGSFNALEDQMASYTPDGYDGSPDHVDAMVWVMTSLMLGAGAATYAGQNPIIGSWGRRR